MVGNHGRQHDEGKRLVECHEERGVKAVEECYLAQYSVEEYVGIECAAHLHGGNDEDGAVDARDEHQGLVEQVGGVHEEGQQRMAEDIVACRPVAHDTERYGVEAGDVEVAYEQGPVVFLQRSEEAVVVGYDDGIESQQQEQQHGGEHAFLAPYGEYA